MTSRRDEIGVPRRIGSETEYSREIFEAARLTGSDVDSSFFEECEFLRCELEKSAFRTCSFSECRFRETNLSLSGVNGSTFSGCTFESCKAMGINWSEAHWPRPRLKVPLRFTGCVLSHSTFFGVDLRDVAFLDCIMTDVDLREACLSGCDFTGTDLSGSIFHEADLSGADLSGARDYSIDPRRTTLKGARFSLPEAISLLGGLGIKLTD